MEINWYCVSFHPLINWKYLNWRAVNLLQVFHSDIERGIGDDINTKSMFTISMLIMCSFLLGIKMKWECTERGKKYHWKVDAPKVIVCELCCVDLFIYLSFFCTLIIRSYFYSIEWCMRRESNAHFILYFPSSHIHISFSSRKISLQRVYTEVIWEMPFVEPKPLMDRKMEWNRQKKKLVWLKGGRQIGGNEESHCV